MNLITREEGAKIHGVSIWTFWHYVKKGLIKPHVSDRASRGHRTRLWSYQDVIAGLDVVKAYKAKRKIEELSKRGPKPIKFKIEFWAGEIKLHPFNVFLNAHVKATPSAEVMI